MGKFTHLNKDEIRSHIEKFGTDDEREILSKIRPVICSGCEGLREEIDDLNDKIKGAVQALS